MNFHQHTQSHQATQPRASRRWAIAAACVVAIGAACASYASGLPAHGHPGHHGPAAMTPEALKEHVAAMVDQCAPDASSDQKARIASIANAAVDDLRSTHEEFRQDHARGHALLMATVIDRRALEQWRAAQIQRVDLMSRRALAALADAAEQLTPEQRAKCGAHMRASMH